MTTVAVHTAVLAGPLPYDESLATLRFGWLHTQLGVEPERALHTVAIALAPTRKIDISERSLVLIRLSRVTAEVITVHPVP
jgi:hypothetical protein